MFYAALQLEVDQCTFFPLVHFNTFKISKVSCSHCICTVMSWDGFRNGCIFLPLVVQGKTFVQNTASLSAILKAVFGIGSVGIHFDNCTI